MTKILFPSTSLYFGREILETLPASIRTSGIGDINYGANLFEYIKAAMLKTNSVVAQNLFLFMHAFILIPWFFA